jgi:hypothetical protein
VIAPKTGNVYAYTPITRDAYFGPGFFKIDAGVSRIFAIHERTQLELRFEAFNVLNRVNLNLATIGGSAGINSSNFGRITSRPGAGFIPSDYDPRILEFAVKLHF